MSTKGIRISTLAGADGDTVTLRDEGGGNAEVYALVVPGPSPDEFTYSAPALGASSDPVSISCGYHNPPIGALVVIDAEALVCTAHEEDGHAVCSRGALGTAVVAHAGGDPLKFAAAPPSGAVPVFAPDDGRAPALRDAIVEHTGKTLVGDVDDIGGYVLWLWSEDVLEVEVTGGLAASGSTFAATDVEVVVPVSGDGLPDAVMAPCDVASVSAVTDAATGEAIDAGDVALSGRRVTYTPNASAATGVRVKLTVA